MAIQAGEVKTERRIGGMTVPRMVCGLGAAALALGFQAAAAPSAALAEVTGRFFGETGVGAGYDDNVYRDATRRESIVLPAFAGLGWGGRLARRTVGDFYYRFSGQATPRERSESFVDHALYAALRRRLAGILSARLEAEGRMFRQPNLNDYDSNRWLARPGLDLNLPSGTQLFASAIIHEEIYPHYDLDNRGPGFEAVLAQDVTLYGGVRLLYRQFDRNYGERLLFEDVSASLSHTRRKDREKMLDARLSWDIRPLRCLAGYEWRAVSSNGNDRDYGPNQSSADNPNPADDRLLADYYSWNWRGPYARIYGRLPWRLTLEISARYLRLAYDSRPARDAAGAFLPGDPTRLDRRLITGLSLTRSFPLHKGRLGVQAGYSRERSESNDALYDFTANRITALLRAWF